MIVKTRKYKIPSSLYIKLGIQNVLRIQWWIFPLMAIIATATFFIPKLWFIVTSFLLFICYFAFWLIQFYGLTLLEENRPMFERISYEITSQRLIMYVSTKQGMPIPWVDIIKAYKKEKYFLLVLSKVHFFYLPFKIFNGDNEISFFTTVLKRKGLLK